MTAGTQADAPADRTLPDAVVRYAEHADGILDVHLPPGHEPGTPRPLVVVLHGGFWRAAWDRRHSRPEARALADEGYVVVTPEYRRTGAGGGWPTTFVDVMTAVDAAPALLDGLGVPVTTTTLVGHSAGGHLALWLATQAMRLDRVVALAPVGDLRAAYDLDLDDGAVRDLLGVGPEEHPERYELTDPALRADQLRRHVPVVVLHGSADDKVPLGVNDWARDAPAVDLRVLDDVDHMALIDPGSDAWPSVLAAVRR